MAVGCRAQGGPAASARTGLLDRQGSRCNEMPIRGAGRPVDESLAWFRGQPVAMGPHLCPPTEWGSNHQARSVLETVTGLVDEDNVITTPYGAESLSWISGEYSHSETTCVIPDWAYAVACWIAGRNL